ncbi:MAG: GNAT family N-acetyltransferase [Chloroflexi bacterium]|nr:GNAT family N-acetyltransferase [Chloroflexota bacterium]
MIPGKVIRLRPIERADLPRFVEWFADPEVREGITLFMPLSLAQEELWFEEALKRDRAEQPFAIEAPAANGWTMIGTMGFDEINWRNRRGEFGIVIGAKEFWDRALVPMPCGLWWALASANSIWSASCCAFTTTTRGPFAVTKRPGSRSKAVCAATATTTGAIQILC